MQLRMLRPFRAWQTGEVIELPNEAATAWIDEKIAEEVVPVPDSTLPGDPQPGVVDDPEAYAAAVARGEIDEIPPDDPRATAPVGDVQVEVVEETPKTGRRK